MSLPRSPTPPRTPTISVVVPARNGAATIASCIESLLATEYPPDRREILVVDNGSSDATATLIKARPVRYLHEPKRGVSHARNRGIAESSGEVVAFLDADCVVDPSWLAELARPFEDPEVGCVAGELEHQPPATAAQRQAARMLGRWQRFAVNADPPFVVTANAAFRRTALDRIGWFDPELARAQDVDIGRRFHEQSGARLVLSPGAVARHQHSPTQLGFFRQQLGWAYGAGLVQAKYRSTEKSVAPPRLRDIGWHLRGLWATLAERARGRGRAEYTEDAWFSLIRQLAVWAGRRAGIARGSLIWRSPSESA